MRSLIDLDVLVVDCQATGASPAFGHVLELGWGVQRAKETTLSGAKAHWIQLPEGHRVSVPVRKVTGYDPRFASEAIADFTAWQAMRVDTGLTTAVPTVIHYARFELAFLREWADRFEAGQPFALDVVCLHAVARRLYPDLPRQSIRALAGYLGHGLDLARRSLGHVEATGFIWRRLRDELVARGVDSWEALHAFVAERAAARPRSSSKPQYPIAPERYRSLPGEPGVYRFLRPNGDVLYVGKAANLRKRTTSHFSARSAKLLAPEMLTQVHAIAATVTASALEAALLENETIKALRPPYNAQLVPKHAEVWYATHAFDGASRTPDALHPHGPLPSERSLLPLAALIELVGGAAATEASRAQAVGVSALFTPDPPSFDAGWKMLSERHTEALGGTRPPRRRVLELARKLLVTGVAPETEDAPESEDSELGVEVSTWDAPRVARHIEQALVQAYRAYRRAHWLRLIHDCDIVYREPAATRARLLEVRGGVVVTTEDAPLEHAPTERLRRRDASGPPSFDRAKYDRLRVLTTELKRIVRDGGTVTVHWGPHRPLPAAWLAGILAAT